MDDVRLDKYRGCLVGLACGDAMGAPVEFESREERDADPISEMIGGGDFGWAPGQVTDDTAMMLCVAESLVLKGKLDPEDILARFIAWLDTNPPDVGTHTRQALELARTESLNAGQILQQQNPNSAGNGSGDYLIISSKIASSAVRQAIAALGGNPRHCSVYPNRRRFMRSRHFMIDQGALGIAGQLVAFATKMCLKDLTDKIIRPTHWAKIQDPARRDFEFSATLCGRVVRLVNLSGFQPSQTLARYIAANWRELDHNSRSFRWHATKSLAVLNGESLVPIPAFVTDYYAKLKASEPEASSATA